MRLNKVFLICEVFLIFALLLISSCNSPRNETGQTAKAKDAQKILQKANNKPLPEGQQPQLTTKLTEASDLTGDWAGFVHFQDNALNPNCKYEGVFDLTLQQAGNNLGGAYFITINKADKLLKTSLPCLGLGPTQRQAVTGAVSSSTIELSDNFNKFAGSFTTGLLTLSFESCPNGRCADGSAGVGVKGTTKLTRQR